MKIPVKIKRPKTQRAPTKAPIRTPLNYPSYTNITLSRAKDQEIIFIDIQLMLDTLKEIGVSIDSREKDTSAGKPSVSTLVTLKNINRLLQVALEKGLIPTLPIVDYLQDNLAVFNESKPVLGLINKSKRLQANIFTHYFTIGRYLHKNNLSVSGSLSVITVGVNNIEHLLNREYTKFVASTGVDVAIETVKTGLSVAASYFARRIIMKATATSTVAALGFSATAAPILAGIFISFMVAEGAHHLVEKYKIKENLEQAISAKHKELKLRASDVIQDSENYLEFLNSPAGAAWLMKYIQQY